MCLQKHMHVCSPHMHVHVHVVKAPAYNVSMWQGKACGKARDVGRQGMPRYGKASDA